MTMEWAESRSPGLQPRNQIIDCDHKAVGLKIKTKTVGKQFARCFYYPRNIKRKYPVLQDSIVARALPSFLLSTVLVQVY